MQRMCNQDSTLTNRILFTDEAILAIWNFQRAQHTWAEKNPHCVVQNKYRREFNMNATQLRVLNNKLIGLFFLSVYLTREIYLEFLKIVLPQLLEGVSLHMRRNIWFMWRIIDPFRPRCHAIFEKYPDRWIQRGMPSCGLLDFPIWISQCGIS